MESFYWILLKILLPILATWVLAGLVLILSLGLDERKSDERPLPSNKQFIAGVIIALPCIVLFAIVAAIAWIIQYVGGLIISNLASLFEKHIMLKK